tara:strand:- start:3786 stop:4550 length:765 start_codon:yes stop_codon:yes gene_type:complete
MEGYDYIDKLLLYEYNFTHTGIPKNYELESLITLIPKHLQSKLYYKKVDITNYVEYAYENGPLIHEINEPIQRSWAFNDSNITFNNDDIIIDIDIDEIIYQSSYIPLIKELEEKNRPLSIKMNQFFYKNNYLWTDLIFTSPAIYKYNMTGSKIIKGLKIKNFRDVEIKTSKIYGCHMSWVMPVDYMLKKLHSYSHPEYRHFCDKKILEKAIEDKKYVFNLNRPFNIQELNINDPRIPIFLQKKNIFDYLKVIYI